jgi:hypothetical protein
MIATLQEMVDYFADSVYLDYHLLTRLLDLWSAVQEAQMQALMTRGTIVQAAEYLIGVHALADWVMRNSDDDGEVPIVVDESQAMVEWINREALKSADVYRVAVFEQYVAGLKYSLEDGFTPEFWLKQMIAIAQTSQELTTIEYGIDKTGRDLLAIKRQLQARREALR